MTITLSPDAEKIIREKVKSGEYATAEDVILAGLRVLDQKDDFAPGELDALIAAGRASAAEHGTIPAEDVYARLKRKSDERLGGAAR